MGMCFESYACPFEFFTTAINVHRFDEFVSKAVNKHNKEKREKMMFEVWVHRDFEHSFDEFMRINEEPKETKPIDAVETLNYSKNMLKDFTPF